MNEEKNKEISEEQKEKFIKEYLNSHAFFDDINSIIHFLIGVLVSLLSVVSVFWASVVFWGFILYETVDFYLHDLDYGDILEFLLGLMFGQIAVNYYLFHPFLGNPIKIFKIKLI